MVVNGVALINEDRTVGKKKLHQQLFYSKKKRLA